MGYRIIFAGTPTFSVPCLDALIQAGHHVVAVYTQPDRPAGRGQKITASPVKMCAISHDLPVLQPHSLRHPDAQRELASFNADLMVVVAYGLILPAEILSMPHLGCFNVHASLLPRLRGAAPIHRAILAGDTETGITIMQMDTGLDTGPMLLQSRCPIQPHDTTGTLHDRLSILGAEALIEALENVNNLTPEPQENTLATYASKVSKTEARIDWQQPAAAIARQIRAFNPWPGAFTGSDQTPLKIWQAEALSTDRYHDATPGEIIRTDTTALDIATGQGLLRIKKLQFAGGKIVHAADIIHANLAALQPGTVL